MDLDREYYTARAEFVLATGLSVADYDSLTNEELEIYIKVFNKRNK